MTRQEAIETDDYCTDNETIDRIEKWKDSKLKKSIFSWPTDGCGYYQHIRFVNYRNERWNEEAASRMTFDSFLESYCRDLEAGRISENI